MLFKSFSKVSRAYSKPEQDLSIASKSTPWLRTLEPRMVFDAAAVETAMVAMEQGGPADVPAIMAAQSAGDPTLDGWLMGLAPEEVVHSAAVTVTMTMAAPGDAAADFPMVAEDGIGPFDYSATLFDMSRFIPQQEAVSDDGAEPAVMAEEGSGPFDYRSTLFDMSRFIPQQEAVSADGAEPAVMAEDGTGPVDYSATLFDMSRFIPPQEAVSDDGAEPAVMAEEGSSPVDYRSTLFDMSRFIPRDGGMIKPLPAPPPEAAEPVHVPVADAAPSLPAPETPARWEAQYDAARFSSLSMLTRSEDGGSLQMGPERLNSRIGGMIREALRASRSGFDSLRVFDALKHRVALLDDAQLAPAQPEKDAPMPAERLPHAVAVAQAESQADRQALPSHQPDKTPLVLAQLERGQGELPQLETINRQLDELIREQDKAIAAAAHASVLVPGKASAPVVAVIAPVQDETSSANTLPV